ncbi:sensor histidine kinase [Pseudonocardia humida]|uniref:histidine kinase n=1 Tax=Pseudonocardia humida TaxID=2800819 RepID=A0ABT1A8K1_9PSEU|nr:sensor histidine kinase [Pseudonocardia humida]MCO1659270.1 CHASE3 domain-containing protein [Pseudonocardia humida]
MTVSLEREPRRRALRHNRSGAAEERWPLSRMFGVGVTAAALVALIVIGLGAFGLWQLTEARARLLEVGGPSTLAAERLTVALVNQETGIRGAQLSGGSPEFILPYRAGVEARQTQTEIIRRLSGEPGQEAIRDALDGVEAGITRWRVEYAEPVIAGVSPPVEQGRAQFEEVRTDLHRLTDALAVQQQGLRAGLNDSASFLIWIGIAIVVLLASFLVITGIGLRRTVLRPVAELAGEVREVVSGNVQREVRADGPREIVQLGEDVEAMRRHILNDLIDAKSVNRRLDEQARDLERSNRDLEQFAYVASHDLQEPLRKVSSFCQLLQRRYGGQLDERADQYIEFAVDGAQRMQRLINDLLSFSRVGRTTEAFERVDLATVAKSAAAQLDGLREQAGGTFEIGELPEVRGDRALLQQLLVNLMGNGLKFHRDGVPPVVRVDAERVGDNWEISVADNGIGIEPEYAEKVFVIFQRLHGRDRYPGTGIGLALAKKIVEFHGGRIGLDSRSGSEPGARIRFALPADPTDSEEETA